MGINASVLRTNRRISATVVPAIILAGAAVIGVVTAIWWWQPWSSKVVVTKLETISGKKVRLILDTHVGFGQPGIYVAAYCDGQSQSCAWSDTGGEVTLVLPVSMRELTELREGQVFALNSGREDEITLLVFRDELGQLWKYAIGRAEIPPDAPPPLPPRARRRQSRKDVLKMDTPRE